MGVSTDGRVLKGERTRAVILGLPFDCGAHPARIGSRLGPSAIRQESLALERGAGILRVHDVKEAVEVVTLWRTLQAAC